MGACKLRLPSQQFMITLRTLKDATAQQVFDQIADHMLTQFEQCAEGMGCRYRLEKLKCAGGCIISDEEYEEFGADKLEDNSWHNLCKDLREKVDGVETHKDLIGSLQDIHDGYFPDSWLNKLHLLATRHNFDTSILDKHENKTVV